MIIDQYFPLYFTVFLASLVFTVILERHLIPLLSNRASQPIYSEGPSWHSKKSGTPTMGGIGFVIASFISLTLASLFLLNAKKETEAISIFLSLAFACANALVGIIDDITKIKHQRNKGLTAGQKLLFQIVLCAIFLFLRHSIFVHSTAVKLVFGEIDLGPLYYPVSLLALLGTVNCANLTDGIDGLASSVACTVGVILLFISSLIFNDVAIISASLIGITIGFLFFNKYPAKIFMGDTGSLFLGAMVASCALSMNNPLILIFIGGVYLIEGGSVILQVVYFKATKKRLFKMAPIHHHLEKCGMTEKNICLLAILVTLLLSIPALTIFGL